MRFRRSASCALSLALSLCLLSCLTPPTKKKQTKESHFFKSVAKPPTVTAMTVTAKEIPLVISTSGKTEVTDRYEAKAPAKVKVEKVFVEEGDRVNPGDPLVKFNDDEIKLRVTKARAEVQEAEAGLANTRYLNDNKDSLIADGKLSQLEADGLDEKVNLYQATMDRAKAEIDLYERATDLSQINSPIAGTVTKKLVSDGSEVDEDQPLVDVIKLDPIHFVVTVPSQALTALDKNVDIAIKFPDFPDQTFQGDIANVGAEAQAEVGGVEIKINVPNPDRLLKSEMKGTVVIRTQGKKKILPIVETALLKTEKSQYVFKIEGKNVKRVAVDLGDPYNNQPTVEKGLAAGDTIVSEVSDDLKDGGEVEVQASRAAEK